MTYIIGMVSQKGGVGKSTLARMMAREFVSGGMSAKIADLDTQQQTCTNWAGRRAENGVSPEIQVQSFASVKSALAEAERFDALLLDGKPIQGTSLERGMSVNVARALSHCSTFSHALMAAL